ncbi:MAG: primosomal protein N' [Nitrospiraceae bacterium]|nr:primosomal protein N' [Nitrospiraceae bacterium]
MEFIDVVFPLNLGPLTYKCPEHLNEKALPGMFVSAPLKKHISFGIILGKSSKTIKGEIKTISEVHGESPMLEPPLLNLLEWMSDYYIANKGIVLKSMLTKEVFKPVKQRKSVKAEKETEIPEILLDVDENILSKINESISQKEYKTFLMHAPSSLYEISFMTKLLKPDMKAIVLVPEIVQLNHIAPYLKKIFGEKLCILHSSVTKGQRSEAYSKIISGECNVVLGTRSAIFAPLKNPSMIIVMHEQSTSYKTEEGFRYNARDIAVMRGLLEKTTVVLSSICPSIESIYNAKKNKYTLLKPSAILKKPAIRIVNMYNEKQPNPNLSKTVVDAASSAIKKNERIMFVINKKGYSMLSCKECENIETCSKCGIPLVLHNEDKSLRCSYCGIKTKIVDSCSKCKSFKVALTGAGIQRIEESIKKLFNIQPIRLDSDKIQGKADLESFSEMIKGEAILLGTKLLTKRLNLHDTHEGLGMAAVLNADFYLNLPDFRSAEKAYQEIYAIADRVKPEGRIFLQTRMPQNDVYRFLRNYDYDSFCNEELSRRKAMLYPPYSKLAIITFKGRDYNEKKVKDRIQKLLKENEDMEILGPSLSMTKKGQKEYSLLMKSPTKNKVNLAAREFLKIGEEEKNLKINIAIDA